MTNEIIERLVIGGENERMEILAHAEENAIGRNVAAFLNTDGGTLIIGVNDRGNVIGTDATETDVRRTISQRIAPRALFSVTAITMEEKPCLIVDVPPGSEFPYVFNDEIYVRSGSNLRRASIPELSAMIARRNAVPLRWERLPALGFELEDLDAGQIARTAREAQERNLYRWTTPENDFALLEQLSLAEAGMLRNSAVVLFGQRPQIRYPQVRIRIRMVRFASEERELLLANRLFEGNLFDLLNQTMEFLRASIPTVSLLPQEGLIRTDQPAYPLSVLREAMLNALVHRDYAAFDGSISLALFPGRMELWNPGSLPPGMTVAELKQGGIPALTIRISPMCFCCAVSSSG